VREFLANKQITVLGHPPYSPDLAPNDFFLFAKTKEILKGSHFDDTDDIRSNTMTALRPFHKTSSKIVLKGGLGAGISA
jgi:transposase